MSDYRLNLDGVVLVGDVFDSWFRRRVVEPVERTLFDFDAKNPAPMFGLRPPWRWQ